MNARRAVVVGLVLLLGAVLAPATGVAADAPYRAGSDTNAGANEREARPSVRLRLPSRAMAGQPLRVAVQVSPARQGRPVRVQRLGTEGWRDVATARQSRTGRAVGTTRVAAGVAVARYRAVVPRWRGLPRAVSPSARLRVVPERVLVSDRLVVVGRRAAERLVPTLSLGGNRVTRLSYARSSGTEALDRLIRGQVVSVPPTRALPHGALLEVVARQVRAGRAELDVVLASLSDVVVNVPDSHTDVALTQVGPVRITPQHEGVASVGSSGPARVVLDVDSGPDLDGGRPGLRTRGEVLLRPVGRLVYDVDWGRVARYGLAFGWDLDESLLSTMRPADSFDVAVDGWPLFTAGATFRGSIGRLPVWLSITGVFRLELAPREEPTVTVEWRREGVLAGVARSTADPRRVALSTLAPDGEVDVRTALDGRAGGTMRTSTTASLYSARGLQVDGHREVDTLTDRGPGGQCLVRDDAGTSLMSGGADLLRTLLVGAEAVPGWVGEPEPEPVPRACPPSPRRLEVLTSALPEVVSGEDYATALEVADHRSGDWTLVRGALPAGLALSSDGRITGTHTGPVGTRELGFLFVDETGETVSVDLELAVVRSRTGSRWRTIDGGPTSCGIRVDDTLWCWGRNEHGQVGDGTTIDRPVPVQVPGAWASVTAGPTSCAVRIDDTAYCWGENYHGQVGDGTNVDRTRPVRLPGLWRTLVPGPTSCGVRTDGTGWCWGDNTLGQVGDGSVVGRRSPIRLDGVWRQVLPGTRSCGVRADDTAWCWGAGHVRLDDGVPAGSPLVGLAGRWASLSDPALGCGILTDGRGWCEPSWMSGGGPVLLDGELTSMTVELGSWCAVRVDATGWCWGDNRFGQSGDGDSNLERGPHRLAGTWTALATAHRSCGLRTDRTAWCWGYNRYGGVGAGTTSRTESPSALAGTWSAVDDACGVRTDGTGWCWGSTALGPVAEDATSHRTTPVQLP